MSEPGSIDERIRRALREDATDARFDPAGWGTPTGPRRRRRLSGRLVAVAAAVLLLVGLFVPLTLLSLLDRPDPGPERGTRPAILPATPDDPATWKECRSEAPDHQIIDPPVGPPGTLVEIRGAVDTGADDDGEPGPDPERFRAWWNLDPAAWESALTEDPRPAVGGQAVFELKRQFLSYTAGHEPNTVCPYQIMVDAPDGEAGTYPIVVLYGGYGREAAWSSLPAVEFTLTPRCPSGTGPWSHPGCPEAAWIRDVIDQVGFRITGRTRRALVVEQPDDPAFAPWKIQVEVMRVADADANGLDPSTDDSYRIVHRLYGTELYSDDTSYSWDRDGVRVWIRPGPDGDPYPFEAVDAIVRASGLVGIEPIESD